MTGGRSGLPVDIDFEYIDRDLAGLWQHSESDFLLRMVPEGRFSLAYSADAEATVVLGRVSEIEGVLRFLYDPSIPMCVGVVGKYLVEELEKSNGDSTLKLAVMEDSCESRQVILSGLWRRIEGLTRLDKAEEAGEVDLLPQGE